MGITAGMVVQQIGHDDDVDLACSPRSSSARGTELSDEDSDDVVDVVLLWWREGDGDLVDALMDARTRLDAAGSIWVLTPKAGRPDHVEPSDILDAAPTAGLTQTSTVRRVRTGPRRVSSSPRASAPLAASPGAAFPLRFCVRSRARPRRAGVHSSRGIQSPQPVIDREAGRGLRSRR